jgi:two-component system response regulator YesN
MFKNYNYIVFKAEDGRDAWYIFNNENTNVVLTDIRMPGLDGRKLSYRIRNQSPSTIIALMTGEEIVAGSELLNDEAVDYLFLKPFDTKMVCEIFRAELDAA